MRARDAHLQQILQPLDRSLQLGTAIAVVLNRLCLLDERKKER